MLTEDRKKQPPHTETPHEAISQFPATEVEPIAPTPNKFPWKWVIGIIIAIPISAIGLLAGGLFLISALLGPNGFGCGESPNNPEKPTKNTTVPAPTTAPTPGKSL